MRVRPGGKKRVPAQNEGREQIFRTQGSVFAKKPESWGRAQGATEDGRRAATCRPS